MCVCVYLGKLVQGAPPFSHIVFNLFRLELDERVNPTDTF